MPMETLLWPEFYELLLLFFFQEVCKQEYESVLSLSDCLKGESVVSGVMIARYGGSQLYIMEVSV